MSSVTVGRRAAMLCAGRGLLPLLSLVVVLLAACGTDYEGTQREATEAARDSARSAERSLADLVAEPGAPEGVALLKAVQDLVPTEADRGITVLGSELADGVVHHYVSFDGEAQSGGGGTFYNFRARLCVEYRIRSGDEPDVTVEDAPCSRGSLQSTGPTGKADRTVSLED